MQWVAASSSDMTLTAIRTKSEIPLQALIAIGLGGGAFHFGIALTMTLALSAVGIMLMYRGRYDDAWVNAWEVPRELRLLHFGFWFFAGISVLSWLLSGSAIQDSDSLARAAVHGQLLLFWPLVVALAYCRFSAMTLFLSAAVIAVVAALIVLGISTAGSGSLAEPGAGNSYLYAGYLAMLCGGLSLVGSLWSDREGHGLRAALLLLAALLGLGAAVTSRSATVLLGLPALLLLVVPLLQASRRLGALVGIVVLALALAWLAASRHEPIFSIPQPQLTAQGLPGLLSGLFLIGLPLWLFIRHIPGNKPRVKHVAAAGAMVPVAYMTAGLTQTTLNLGLLLNLYLILTATAASALFLELSRSYSRNRAVRVSATIITRNEAHNIGDCLRSVQQIADEIIVLDSGSTDATVEIARNYTSRVEVTDWPGFGVQKQRALAQASGDWVLSIDADERVSTELAREINDCLADPDADAYKLPWAVTIYGKQLDFGRSGRAPLRLFRREGVSFSDALVHEKIILPRHFKVRTLRGRLTHYTHRDFGHSLEKSASYAWLGAREKHRRGKRTPTLLYPSVRALLTFIQIYFLRFGFLDGQVGYLTAVIYAQVTFNKYAGLWTLRRKQP